MVGNAVPPLLTYYIANSMLGTRVCDVPSPKEAAASFVPPSESPEKTKPDRKKVSYQPKRKFRASVPGLRFKSGTRFELSNSFSSEVPNWRFRFFFGDSKRVGEIVLNNSLLEQIKQLSKASLVCAVNSIVEIGGVLGRCNPRGLQSSWSHLKEDQPHPHDLVDAVAEAVRLFMSRDGCSSATDCVSMVMQLHGNPPGTKKILRNAREVFAGMVVCSIVNDMMEPAE
jgi:DNA (cytosine-5)-methyltransferase 1